MVLLALVFILIITPAASASTAPDFTVPTTDGEFTLSEADKPVLIDFMSFQCIACKELEGVLKEVYPEYQDKVIFISIDVGGHSVDELQSYREENDVPWHMGQGNDQISIIDYRLSSVPTMVLVNEDGNMTYKKTGTVNADVIRAELDKLIEGTDETVEISEYGIYVLAVMAGLFSFFSPCAFPLLPSYIAFYMRPDDEEEPKSGLTMGFKAAAGIVLVFGILGGIGMLFGSFILRGLPYLEPLVGAIILILGITLVAGLDVFSRLGFGWQNFKSKLFPRSKNQTNDSPFLYGVGYASASLACVGPVFLAIIASSWLTGGLMGTALVLALHLLTMAVLMILFSLLTVYFRDTVVKDFRDKIEWINKISGVVLIIAGIYLIYMYIQ